MGLCEEFRQLGGKASHFFFKRLTVILLIFNSNIASRSEDIVLLCNILSGHNSTEALFVFQRSLYISVVGVGNLLDVLVGQLTQLASNHCTELSCINEQRLAFLLLVLGDKPKRYRNLSGVEKLCRHSNNAVHQIGVDDVFADLTFATGLRGQRAICQHHTDASIWGKVPDHVLQPSEVGITGRGCTILPAHII